jgi:hypothetical protein
MAKISFDTQLALVSHFIYWRIPPLRKVLNMNNEILKTELMLINLCIIAVSCCLTVSTDWPQAIQWTQAYDSRSISFSGTNTYMYISFSLRSNCDGRFVTNCASWCGQILMLLSPSM